MPWRNQNFFTLANQPLLSLQQSHRIAAYWGDSSGLQIHVCKGRLIRLYAGETQSGHTEGWWSCLDRLERCCLPFFPPHWLFLLMAHSQQMLISTGPSHPHYWFWPSAAWPAFWFCVPTPGASPPRWPWSLPACSQLIPDVRQLWQSHALREALHNS